MDYSPVFLKARTIAFSLISLISFIWIIVLCVDLFLQWEGMDRSEKSLLAIMLLTDTLTLIMLIVLILLPFRPWLDGARFLLLLIAHIGIASAFVVWNPQFQCSDKTPDQQGVCRLLNMYILIANWIIPAFLITYAAGLSLMVYKRTRQLKMVAYDAETTSRDSRQSILPIMQVDIGRLSVSNTSCNSTTGDKRSGASHAQNTRRQLNLPVEPYDVSIRRPSSLPGPVAPRVSTQHLSYAPHSRHQSILTTKSVVNSSGRPSTLSSIPKRGTMEDSRQPNIRHQSILPTNSLGASPKHPNTFNSIPYRETTRASGQHLSVESTPRTPTDGRTMLADAGDMSKPDVRNSALGRSRLSKPLPSWML